VINCKGYRVLCKTKDEMLALKLLLYLVKNALKTCFPTVSKGKKNRHVKKFKKLYDEKDEARKY